MLETKSLSLERIVAMRFLKEIKIVLLLASLEANQSNVAEVDVMPLNFCF
jgi:hypothetical protein